MSDGAWALIDVAVAVFSILGIAGSCYLAHRRDGREVARARPSCLKEWRRLE